jgi:hypothetical protein
MWVILCDCPTLVVGGVSRLSYLLCICILGLLDLLSYNGGRGDLYSQIRGEDWLEIPFMLCLDP